MITKVRQFFGVLILLLVAISAKAGIFGCYVSEGDDFGQFRLDTSNGGLSGKLEFVAGNPGCSGSIDGTGTVKSNAFEFVKHDDSNTCKIVIQFSGVHAEVSEDGCTPWHGAGCQFEGTYKKAKVLPNREPCPVNNK